MADELQVGRASIKRRNPWGTWLLTFFTLGIYFFVWYYKINVEMRDYEKSDVDVAPVKAVLAVTIGALVVVPFVISLYNTADRVRRTQQAAGSGIVIQPWLALVLAIFRLYQPYVQTQLNKAWDVEFEAAGG